jgi:hypothetical protein
MKMFGKITMAFVIMAAMSAFAAEKSITLQSDTTLNGQKLAAGDYKVVYNLKGSTTEVKFMQGKKDVASATGQVVENDAPAADTLVVRSQQPNGASSIVELQLAHQKSSIRFAPESSDKGN